MAKAENDHPDRLSETLESLSQSLDLYILFLDLCDSTEFKQFCLENDIPESQWVMRQKVFLWRAATIIRRHSGTIIKTIGDELMATFPLATEPSSILACCNEVFSTFASLKSYNKGRFRILCKAAVDFGSCYNGEVLDYSVFDPIGTCVDRCARISKHSGPGIVVFSEAFHEAYTEKHGPFGEGLVESLKDKFKGLGEIFFSAIKRSLNRRRRIAQQNLPAALAAVP